MAEQGIEFQTSPLTERHKHYNGPVDTINRGVSSRSGEAVITFVCNMIEEIIALSCPHFEKTLM